MVQKRVWWGGAVALGLVAVVAAAWWWRGMGGEGAAYRMAAVERGRIEAVVAASGTVNPVALVTVGSQVSGQIRDVLVDFNSEVKAGQLLAQIDPETFEYRVRSAQADVDAAQAAVGTAQAALASAQTQVLRAQVDLDEARRDAERKQGLAERQFIAPSEADKARALVNTSTHALQAAQAQVGVAQAQLRSAQAGVAQRQATLAQARIDLARTRITSPIQGIVIKRAIERGQTVAASLQSPELFVLAKNLSDMQVEAAIDESDVGRLQVGQKASFTVDAFAGQSFSGVIRQVRKAATNVSNVVTYVAVIGFANEAGRLLPGMTANVRVVTDVREDVLKVPNAALRVRINGDAGGSAAPKPSTPGGASADEGALPARGGSSAAAGAPAEGARSPATEFRNRVVQELGLDSAQTARVDAVYAELRPQFQALRELAPEERGKARERLNATVRERIGAVLTPAQQPRFAVLVAEVAASRRGGAGSRGRVYVLGEDGKPRAVAVRLGLSDGSSTEILPQGLASEDAQALRAGAQVVVGVPSASTAGAAKPSAPGPRMGF